MSRSASQWMPFYIADYLADTTRLNTAQHGAYMLLLMELWRNGPIPFIASELALITRVDEKTFEKKIWPSLKRYFVTDENGEIDQKRMRFERKKSQEISDKRRAAVSQRKDRKGYKTAKEDEQINSTSSTIVDTIEGDLKPTRASNHHSHNNTLSHSVRERHALDPEPVSSNAKSKSSKRGTRLPDGWQPSQDLVDLALKLKLNPEWVTDNFRDYWKAAPGAKGVKLDWNATFRRWCRTEAERKPNRFLASQNNVTPFPRALSGSEQARQTSLDRLEAKYAR